MAMPDVGNEFKDGAEPGITSKAVNAVTFSAKAVDYCVGKVPGMNKVPLLEFEQEFPSL